MKTTQIVSLALITIGIALCAAVGARLSDGVFKSQRVPAQLQVVDGYLKTAQATLEAAQASGEEQRDIPTNLPAKLMKLPQSLTETSGPLKINPEMSPIDQLKASVAWLTLIKDQLSAAKAEAKPQAPRARLSSWWAVNYLSFLFGLALIVAGALSARRQSAQLLNEPTQGDRALDLGEALNELTQTLSALEASSREVSEDDASARDALRDELSDALRARLEPIVDARDRARAKLGLARYADIFGLIAQGERRLNRAWAALVDGHLPEARRSLEGGVSSIRDARDALSATHKDEQGHA